MCKNTKKDSQDFSFRENKFSKSEKNEIKIISSAKFTSRMTYFSFYQNILESARHQIDEPVPLC